MWVFSVLLAAFEAFVALSAVCDVSVSLEALVGAAEAGDDRGLCDGGHEGSVRPMGLAFRMQPPPEIMCFED